MISIVVPVLNESQNIQAFLSQAIFASNDIEIILVDGGSQDDTKKLALASGIDNLHVVDSDPGRAIQMNKGASFATGEILLFLHADTRLPDRAYTEILALTANPEVWGRFDVQLDASGFGYRVISWFINHRSRLSGIATGDQAMFVRRDVFERLGGFPSQPLMEDIELSKSLKEISRPYCIRTPATTSARKWQKEGMVRTVWLMWRLRAAYAMGARAEDLHSQYYR